MSDPSKTAGEQALYIGDPVQLKDGSGPVMFIYDMADGYQTALCNWLVDNHQMSKAKHFVCDLMRVTPPKAANKAGGEHA